MAKTLQFRRGTTSELSSQTGAVGELFVDTTKDTVVVMDGSTAGGFPLATESSLSAYATIDNVNQGLATKQDTLLSGTNIKTVNGTSLLGSGDITISSGSSVDLSAIDEDIIPLFNEVFDLGSENKRWYDGYFSNELNINGATITGTEDGIVIGNLLAGDLLIVDNVITPIDSTAEYYGLTETVPGTVIIDGNMDVQGTFTVNGQDLNTNLTLVGNELRYTNIDGTVQTVDLSVYLDDTTNTISSGTLNGTVITFTRQDNTTFNVDVSALYDDTNLVTSVNGSTGAVSVQPTLVSGENIKTVNGTSLLGSGDITISGGSGSSFDQDLNTTDDVVFNSALVGGVSIIGNEISATDAYGQDGTLVVSSEMQVTVGSISTVNGNPYQNTIRLQLYSYDVSFFIEGAGTWYFNEDFVRALYNNNPDSSPVVSVTFPGPIGMPDTVITGRLKANNGGNPGEWQLGNTNPATVTNIYFDTNYLNEITINGTPVTSHPNYNQAYTIGQQVTFTSGSQTTPLSVTETGVNVEGTFTVNGQPVGGSGSSFDQDLNTTDDVVFNSALIGDVSIVGNTITGTNAYGVADTLVVDGGLTVSFGENIVIDNTEIIPSTSFFFHPSPTIGSVSFAGLSSEQHTKFNNLQAGDIVSFTVNYAGQVYQGQFVFQSIYDDGDLSAVTFQSCTFSNWSAAGDLTQIIGWWHYENNVEVYTGTSPTEILSTHSNVVNVTSAGVAVEGTFTATSLIIDSALIGDVSIIDNQIAVQDSYGLPGTLNVSASEVVINSNLNLAIDSRESTTHLVTDATNTSQFTVGSTSMGGKFTYSPVNGSSWVDAPKFMNGSVISVADFSYGTIVIELTSDFTYNNMFGRWEAPYAVVTNNTGYSTTYTDWRSYAVTVTNSSGSVANYGFDDQGVLTAPTVSTENLLVDGSPAGLLTINQDNSKSVVIDSFVSNTETVNASGASSFSLNSSNFRYSAAGDWTGANQFLTGSIVTISFMGQTSVIQLTSNMSYVMGWWLASYTLISGSNDVSNASSVTVYTESGTTINYDFTESGFVAESALIGDISIIDNQIAVQDSYGLASELRVSASSVAFDQDLNLSVDSTVSTSETVSGMNEFYVYGPMNGSKFSYNAMSNIWADSSKFVTGSIVSVNDSMDGIVVIQLTTDMTYSMMNSAFTASYTVVSGGTNLNISTYNSNTVTVTNITGSIANYDFDDQGTFTTTSVIADSALIGDISIIDNQIAVQDSYGLPGTLNVVASTVAFDSSVTLAIDSLVQTTETISGGAGQFRLNYSANLFDFITPDSAPPYDTNKFVTGTQVTLVDSTYGTFVIELTADLYFSGFRWQAPFTFISGGSGFSADAYASSVIIDNESGSVVNYDFDNQGTFTSTSLLADSALIGDVSIIDNQIAVQDSYGLPGTLNVSASSVAFDSNLDLEINTIIENVETLSDGAYEFTIDSMVPSYFYHSSVDGEFWTDASKFVTGTQVSLTSNMYGTIVIELTSDFAYNTFRAGEWASTYTLISGSFSGQASSYSVTVTNSTGSVANYGFDDQGTFTSPTVSTNELLINGSPPGFLITNQDGSKSVVVDTLSTTITTLNMSGYGTLTWLLNNNDGKYYFLIPTSLYNLYSQYFTAGTVVTGFFDQAGQGSPFTLTLASDMTYQSISAYSGYAAETVETPPGFPPNSQNSIWADEVTITNTLGGISDYNFDSQGTFTTDSLVAETALIGDVSIVANTITATDSYGAADTLVVDGGLDVKTTTPVTIIYSYSSPPAPGQWDGNPVWTGTSLFWNNPTADTLTIINSLNVGDTITFTDSVYYEERTVTLTSAFAYSMMQMAYIATVAESEPTTSNLSPSTSYPLIITSLVTKTSSFDSTGLTVDGDIQSTGLYIGDGGITAAGAAYFQGVYVSNDLTFGNTVTSLFTSTPDYPNNIPSKLFFSLLGESDTKEFIFNSYGGIELGTSSSTSAGTAGQVLTSSGPYGAASWSDITVPNANTELASLGVGISATGTTGEIRATDNITAYFSSDAKLKENIKDVDGALDKVCAIGSKTFDWTDEYIAAHGGEDGYFVQKSDFGVVAQDVQAVFPQAVRTREDGTLAVDYEKLATLAFGAIKELVKRVEVLESK